MKKLICIYFLALSTPVYLFAQDTIIMKNGDEIKSKVIEVGVSEIKYKKFDNLEGPVISILKTDVNTINYENGTKEVFKEEPKTTAISNNSNDLFFKGQKDAALYYKGYKASGTGTLVTSLLSPLAGLIPAIACSSTPPKDKNLGYPNTDLFNKTDYKNGYKSHARKIKSGKVWTNWGIGLGVNIFAYIIIVANSNN